MKKHHKHRFITYFFFVLVVTVIVGVYLYFHGYSDIMIHPKYTEGQIRVACVGDSNTYGYGLDNQPKNSYPIFLAEMLGDGYHVCNFGNIRVTVQPDGDQPYIKTYTYSDSVEYPADILIFMLGTNDAKTLNWQGTDKFREDYNTLLDSYLVGDKKPEVYLCTPVAAHFPEGKDSGSATYGVQPLVVEEIAGIVKEIAAERGYEVIDMNAVTKNRRDLYAKDLIHLTYDGAMLIAETVYEQAFNK